jgi:phosphatidylinositol alpha-1,6-mannosyltransferase
MIAPDGEGAKEFDRHRHFETSRVRLPGSAVHSIGSLTLHTLRQIQEFKPDLILDFLWMPSSVASWLIHFSYGWVRPVPYFTIVHAVEILESDHSLRKRIRKRLSFVKNSTLSHATGVFAVSRFTADQISRTCHVSRDKIQVIANGVDPAGFAPRLKAQDLMEKWGLAGKKVFLTVSRLEDYKGVDRAIAALRHVVKNHPDVIYLVCGQGSDRRRLEAITHHYRMQDYVRFAGAIEFDRLVDYYNLADCLILLSREDWKTPNVEGFGLVFLEAAACGVPAIGGRSGGVPDAVLDGVTGWLVDPSDEREITAAMLESLDQPEERQKRGRQAMERARSELTWEKMAEGILSEVRKSVRN